MHASSHILQRLEDLRSERTRLLEGLCQADELAVGTVARLRRRCGNPTCHCAITPSHEQMLFLYKKEGRRTSTFVRRADEPRLEEAAERYHHFREAIRNLKHVNSKELELLRALMELRALNYTKPEP
jgi:hypothetical protein